MILRFASRLNRFIPEHQHLIFSQASSDPGSPAVLHPTTLMAYKSPALEISLADVSWVVISLFTIFSVAEFVLNAIVIGVWLHHEEWVDLRSLIIKTAIFHTSLPLLNLLILIPLVLLQRLLFWSRQLPECGACLYCPAASNADS
ncbi:hypothetical protein F4678DRAFT_430181 [Xylaria arbuscula]|nr:hypothetical protein F4678DRAFT_430181 [Xylaria arbuscula]